jgi:serine/threonine protein phosphatase PrpC
MKISYAFLSHPGKKRVKNQDGLFINGVARRETTMEHPEEGVLESEKCLGFYVVIDGAGGHSAGEVACAAILDALPEFSERFQTQRPQNIQHGLEEEFNKIQATMTEKARRGPALRDMAATLAGLWISPEGGAVAFNCGDCRAYRIRGGYLDKMTHDHSIVQQLFDAGTISEEDMRVHPQKNVVTAAVQESGAPAEIYCSEPVKLDGRMRFFLCCDGVWEALVLDKIEECLDAVSISGAAGKLFEALMGTQCRDNVSFIVLDVECETEKKEGD